MMHRPASPLIGRLATLIIGTIAASSAFAQTFPSKPIKLIAPYAAGGGADLMARYLCEKWPATLGQPCVVENRPGAAGIIGVEAMLKSEPDGHVLAMMSNTMAIIPALYPKVPYDTVRDIAPIAAFSATPVNDQLVPSRHGVHWPHDS